MDDAYFRNRIDDIDHVIGRLHAALHKRDVDVHGVAGDVLVTDNVATSELAQLQSRGVVAIVTTGCSAPSPSAILARSPTLPVAVGGAQAMQMGNARDAMAVDGTSGTGGHETRRTQTAE